MPVSSLLVPTNANFFFLVAELQERIVVAFKLYVLVLFFFFLVLDKQQLYNLTLNASISFAWRSVVTRAGGYTTESERLFRFIYFACGCGR